MRGIFPGRWRALLAGSLLLASLAASGQEAPPSPPAPPSSPSPSPAALDVYQRALAALESGQYATARQLLEDVVGQQPDFAGAWMDLALATYLAGDTAAALEHLSYIELRFDLPVALQRQIALWQERWQQAPDQHAAPAPGSGWHGEIRLGVMHDSNVNAGLSSGQITLTRPEGSIDLPVATPYRARSDNALLTHFYLLAPSSPALAGELTPWLSLQSRDNESESRYNHRNLQFGALYSLPSGLHPQGRWQILLQGQYYQLGDSELYRAWRGNLSHRQPWAWLPGCSGSLGLEWEERRFPSAQSLGGQFLWLQGGLHCPEPALALSASLGGEQPAAARAGGRNHGANLRLQHSAQPYGLWRLDTLLQYSRIKDSEGYSPLLADNAARLQERYIVELSLNYPLALLGPQRPRYTPGYTEISLAYGYVEQQANLALFQMRERTVGVNLLYNF